MSEKKNEDQAQDNSKSPKLSEQALADYKLLREEPAGHKKQQWTITTYVLALYGVIYTSLDRLSGEKPLLWYATIILCIFGVLGIGANHWYLYFSRKRIDTVQQNIFKGNEKTWFYQKE